MTFTPNIPASGQTLGQTRDDIRNNFTNYNDTISVNHVAPNATGAGKHKFVQMPEQGTAPATAVNEMALYTRELSGRSTLYLRQENSGSSIQMSGVTPALSGNNGYTFLPGGFLIQWGTHAIASGSTATSIGISFPILFLATNSVVVTPSENRNTWITFVGTTQFTVNLSAAMPNSSIKWMAIGTKA